MPSVNIGPDKKEFRLKISLVHSHDKYMRWRVLTFPEKLFKNVFGEYMIEKDDEGNFFLVLTPAFKNNK